MDSNAKLLISKRQVLLREERAFENPKGGSLKKKKADHRIYDINLGNKENRERTWWSCPFSGLIGSGHLIRTGRGGMLH